MRKGTINEYFYHKNGSNIYDQKLQASLSLQIKNLKEALLYLCIPHEVLWCICIAV